MTIMFYDSNISSTDKAIFEAIREIVASAHGVDFADLHRDCLCANAMHNSNPYKFLGCFGEMTAEEIRMYMDIYDLFSKNRGGTFDDADREKYKSLINSIVEIKKTKKETNEEKK